MRVQLKLLTIICCFLFCLNARSEENSLCTTAVMNNIVQNQYAGNTAVVDAWEELKTKTIIKMKGRDAQTRPPMVRIQSVFESSLASLLRNGDIKYSSAVIYMPLPSTPLRANEFNVDTLVRKDFYKDPNRLETITKRQSSLQAYLTNGGMVFTVYNSIKPERNNIPGLDIYRDNIKKYKSRLIDKPVSMINTRYTGASYIVECKDGKKVFFAIKGRQANDVRKKQWVLYYGELSKKNKALDRYFKRLQGLYEEANVNFDFQ